MEHKKYKMALLNWFQVGETEINIDKLQQFSTKDWNKIVEIAVKHNTAPLLYYRIEMSEFAEYVPTEIMQKLQRIYFEQLCRNMKIYHEISKLLNRMDGKIPVIVLKGAALAITVYPNIALRPMSDIDILVKKEDLKKTEQILLELGYSSVFKDNFEFNDEKQHHLPPYMKDDIVIEVHWSIERPYGPVEIRNNKIWENAFHAEIYKSKGLILSPEDLLFHLCLHASYHHRFKIGLIRICDIAETVGFYQEEIDWEYITKTAEEFGTKNSIYLTLYLTKHMLKAKIPDKVLDKLRPESINQKLINLAEERIWGRRLQNFSPVVVYSLLPSKFLDKLRTMLKYLFPSTKTIANVFSIPQNSLLVYPFYLIYHLRFLFRYRIFLWGLIRRDKSVISDFNLDKWLSY